MDSLDVGSEGRVTIPKPVRDEYDLVEGGLVPLRIVGVDDEEAKYPEHFNKKLMPRGRVRIPKNARDKLGIEDGDTVDLELLEW